VSFAAAAAFAAVVQQDLTRRKIPNALPVAVLALGAVKWAAVGRWGELGGACLASGIVFLATCFLFWRGWMGGGDVKLLTAASFMFGSADTLPFVFATSLVGGVLAIGVLVHDRIIRRPAGNPAGAEGSEAPPAQPTVPYGVAIAVAAVWILFKQWTSR
jgi:prepilin peptidase CpaA